MTTRTAVIPESGRGSTLAVFRGLVLRAETVTIVLLLAGFAVGYYRVPDYFRDTAYLLDTTSLSAEVGLLALSMTFVIITGNIDLSVAGGTSLVGVSVALLHARGVPMGWCMVAGLGLGLCLGGFNAAVITLLRLPSLTVTLGTMALYQGVAQILLGDRSQGGFPEWFVGIDYRHLGDFLPTRLAETPLGKVPLPLTIVLGFALAYGVTLAKTVFGRQLYAIGTNEAAARYAGLPVGRVKVIVFVLSGFMMGCAGLMAASRLNTTQYNMANGWELSAITAVVLGGTDIFGGRGSIFGTVVALLLIALLQSEINLEGKPPEYWQFASGALLVLSVLLTSLTNRLKGGRR